jgi:saccharopine dehydrogenase-like NADP-dependent oxidoreductase
MRTILLFGAGKSSSVLIDYLVKNGPSNNWKLVVADADLALAKTKLQNSKRDSAISIDVQDAEQRTLNIRKADIVISLLPPSLHFLVAKDCVALKKNLLTASYLDDKMESLREEIKSNDLLFLCEMGLDPGIDHMSAKKIIDEIQSSGGKVTSFISHCGGLVAPESDDNPWHYKISWNPKNIVNAGKSGAVFKQDGRVVNLSYTKIFEEKRYVTINTEDIFCWYPNRDSLHYSDAYGLNDCPTLIRTTLRHPDFIYGWKNVVDLKLTDETIFYETDGRTLMDFFKEHMDRNNFSSWLEVKLKQQFEETRGLLNNLVNLVKMEENSEEQSLETIEDFMIVNEKGKLQEADMDDLKNNAAATIAFKMHESKLTLRQLFFLGMDDDKTYINKGRCSAAEVLLFALEKKLPLKENDKDMVVMLHEIEYEINNEKKKIESSLMISGEDSRRTAMAKTVGLPLGIVAKLILNGDINLKGLHIPVSKEIYEPVLKELEEYGIKFITS